MDSGWIEAATPTRLSLLDEQLAVANLYGVRNVPVASWIDETGRIARANDLIYAQRRDPVSGQITRNEHYFDGIRNWVAEGAASRFPQDQAALEERRGAPSLTDVEAQTSFQLGLYLVRRGGVAAAQAPFRPGAAARSRPVDLTPPGVIRKDDAKDRSRG